MGTELDAFPFHQQELKARSALEMISSWLDIDDVYAPEMPDQFHLPYDDGHHHHHHHHHHHLHNQHNHNHLYQYLDSSSSDQFDLDPLSLLPTPDSPFPHHLYSADPPPPHTANHHHQTQPSDECDTYLIENHDQFGFITPCESQDSGSTGDDHDQFYEKLVVSPDAEDEEPMSLDSNNVSAAADGAGDADDNEEDDEVEDDDQPSKPGGAAHCKNLLSERNRRKRLSQQLLALRALVPNITKGRRLMSYGHSIDWCLMVWQMDKRSVLVDALNYLRSIHEETARLQKELKQQQNQQQQHQKQPRLNNIKESCQDNPAGTLRVPRTVPAPTSASKPKPQITEIDTERIEDRRFVVKITCKGSNGVGGDVLRVIETMGLEITNATVQQMSQQEILATIFIKVRKPGKMTEDKLKDCITSMALRSGLKLQNP